MLPTSSVADALRLIPHGAHVLGATGCGAPTTLFAGMPEVSPGQGWTLATGILMGEPGFLPAVLSGDLSYRTWHVSACVRKLAAAGTVDYVPLRASRLANHLGTWGVGAALVRVSPPDRNGYVSLGGSVGYGRRALDLAPVRIAEVDPGVPRTRGDSCVHVSVFDALVDSTQPMAEYVSARPDDVSTQIAQHVLELLPQDPTLQIGIGAIPESVVAGLGSADLGRIRFDGMGTDDMVDLFERGVLDVAATVPSPAVRSPELMGTARLMAFAHDNPAIGLYPSSSSHDAARLGAIPRFVSVNTAIEIDLLGQVNSEVIRGRQVSGVGGSLDFVEGAGRSTGGLRVIAVASTSPDGTASRIVPNVATQGVVTVPRACTDVIVTEHGVARLEGLSARERVTALIAIAHPDHRDALAEEART